MRKRLKNVGDLKLLIAVHEILFDLIDIDFNHYFAFKRDRATGGSSRHNCCLVDSNGRVDARFNYLAVRTIKPWNSLSTATKKVYSLAFFKRMLNTIDISSLCPSGDLIILV